ncbi:uncharacterized protein LOC120523466 [Polypterus senegalus]|uniref:uncharacterized protein LOC120523466 n=1 Tax=Polypterus senegalus TaxID=55291 RepID=UPI001962DE4C|nr:uncharacterized protein LOC120523466 [Polypterus senegalus]
MGGQATQMPNISRLVEAVCVELSRIHTEGTTICGVRVNRWAAVMRDYICIRENILTNSVLLAQTRIQLFPLNQRTLAQWHYARTRELQRRDLELAVPLPTSSALATEPTPAARPRPTGPEQSAAQPLHFPDPPDLSVQATQRRRGPVDVAPAIIVHPPVPHEAPATQPLSPPADTASPPLPPPQAGPSVPAPLPGGGRKSRRRRKKKQEADELARQQGILPKQRKKIEEYICKSCGRQKTKEFGHSQFGILLLHVVKFEEKLLVAFQVVKFEEKLGLSNSSSFNPVPQFCRETSGELTLKASTKAIQVTKTYSLRLMAEMVREQARRHVRAACGEPEDSKLERSASELQFGQYFK